MVTQFPNKRLTYKEIHNLLISLLKKSSGLTRKEIMDKIGIKHRRTLHRHLFGDPRSEDPCKRVGLGSSIRMVKEEGKNLIYWEPNYRRLKAIKAYLDQFSLVLTRENVNPDIILNDCVLMFIPEKLEKNRIHLHFDYRLLEEMDADPEKEWKKIRESIANYRKSKMSDIK